MIAKTEPAELLECTYVRRNGAGVVRVSGKLDLPNVHLLAEMLDAVHDDRPAIVVDLAGVSTIDSTGLNLLMRMHERCALRKANMAVVFTSQSLRRIFSVLSLENVFQIFPTVDAAIRALSLTEGLQSSSPRVAAARYR